MFTTIEEVGGHCWDVIEPSDGFHPVNYFFIINLDIYINK